MSLIITVRNSLWTKRHVATCKELRGKRHIQCGWETLVSVEGQNADKVDVFKMTLFE